MTVQQIQLTHTGAAIKVRNFQNFAHGVGENNIKDAALAAGVFFEVLRRQNTRSSLKAFANYLNISTVKAEKHLYERAKKKIWDKQAKCAAFFGERTKKRARRSHAEVCVTKISGMSLRFKVPITAERGSSGISGTRRAQMAPKSSESFCKGHKNIQ